MKKITLVTVMLLTETLLASNSKYFSVNGSTVREITKVGALKELITTDNKAQVMRCVSVRIDQERGTLKTKKAN